MRNLFVNEVYNIMKDDEKAIFLTAECGFNVVEKIQNDFPKRFYNVGIAEQSLVGTAAGVAIRGLHPIAYTMAMFLAMRAYEQIRVDIAYQNLPVILAGVIPGLGYGNSGTTHHSIEDTALMRVLPNMTVVYPSCETDVKALTRELYNLNKPSYIGLARAPKDYEPNYTINDVKLGKAIKLTEGNDVALITLGTMVPIALRTCEILKKSGINVRVYNMHTVKPLDVATIKTCAKECNAIFTLEEENIIGGLGSAVAEVIAEDDEINCKFKRLGIPDKYGEVSGTQDYLHTYYSIDPQGVAKSILEKLK